MEYLSIGKKGCSYNMEKLHVSFTTFKGAASFFKIYYHEKSAPTTYTAVCASEQFLFSCKVTGSGEITDFETNYKPTANAGVSESDIIGQAVIGRMHSDNSTEVQTKTDFASATTIYMGKAIKGGATSAAIWTITKYTFDATGNPTDIKTSPFGTAIWDNRTSTTYT